MPLPPALAARLAKRGLIQSKAKTSSLALSSVHPPGYIEEVIAEDYDDPEPIPLPSSSKAPVVQQTKPSAPGSNFFRLGHIGCPNKCNIYHTCSKFCVIRWGRGHPVIDGRNNRKRLRMLKKYPIGKGWVEVYDPGCGRYYYWRPETGDVSWLSPRHPKAAIRRPAAELRAEISLKEKERSAMPPPSVTPRNRDDRKVIIEQKLKDRKRREKKDDLDPMDPAAYSDIPRGDWSSGLEKTSDAKTGVDSTASGPLFQSRPYPSPGAILRANAESKSK